MKTSKKDMKKKSVAVKKPKAKTATKKSAKKPAAKPAKSVTKPKSKATVKMTGKSDGKTDIVITKKTVDSTTAWAQKRGLKQIVIWGPEAVRDKVRTAAERAGMAMSAWILEAVDAKLREKAPKSPKVSAAAAKKKTSKPVKKAKAKADTPADVVADDIPDDYADVIAADVQPDDAE